MSGTPFSLVAPEWPGVVGVSGGIIRFPNHSRWVLDGDSITQFKPLSDGWRGWWMWAWFLSGGKLYIPPSGNTAVGGSTTTDVISRLSTDAAFAPKLYSCLIGTNNSGEFITDLQTIYASLRAVGSAINTIPILPRKGPPQGDVDIRSANAINANAFIRSLNERFYIRTDFENVYDPGLSVSPIQSPDGLHPSTYGGYLIGNSWVAQMANRLSSSSILPVSVTAENLATNPLFSGTGGTKSGTGISGTVADSWTALLTPTGTLSCVCSKGTLSNGQPAQVFTFSGSGSGNINIFQTLTLNGLLGDNFEAWCAVEWSGTGVLGTKISAASTFLGGDATSSGSNMFSPVAGVLRAQPITLTGSVATKAMSIQCYVDAGPSCVFKIGQLMVRKVPSGQ